MTQISQGHLVLPKKYNSYTFLFANLPMTWNVQNQSFMTTQQKVGLTSIDGANINSMVQTYIEFIMPTNEDDRLYMYVKSPSQLWYFFGFKQSEGVMEVCSNNTRFNDELAGLKDKDRIFKMDDDGVYEILEVSPSRAQAFVRRVQDANQ